MALRKLVDELTMIGAQHRLPELDRERAAVIKIIEHHNGLRARRVDHLKPNRKQAAKAALKTKKKKPHWASLPENRHKVMAAIKAANRGRRKKARRDAE